VLANVVIVTVEARDVEKLERVLYNSGARRSCPTPKILEKLDIAVFRMVGETRGPCKVEYVEMALFNTVGDTSGP